MARLLYLSLLFLTFYSCKPEYKKCYLQTQDNSLKAYNEVLNEVIIKNAYNFYLGKEEEQIFKRYATNISDSDNIDRDVIKLHNKLFDDTSRFCTVYLDTLLRPAFDSWSSFEKDTSNQFKREVRNMINKFSENGKAVIDSLNLIQTKYRSGDFRSCVARIKSLKELKTDQPRCYIGRIALSKVALNATGEKGLIYYEFRCGDFCGYGRLVLIEKNNNQWSIAETLETWIS